MKTFTINGKKFKAEDCKDGILINPILPKNFDKTPNNDRPESHDKWWYLPYINTHKVEEMYKWKEEANDKWAEERLQEWKENGRAEWMKAWPGGTRYDVRCLDGEAWDRSTNWGMFGSLEEALKVARGEP